MILCAGEALIDVTELTNIFTEGDDPGIPCESSIKATIEDLEPFESLRSLWVKRRYGWDALRCARSLACQLVAKPDSILPFDRRLDV